MVNYRTHNDVIVEMLNMDKIFLKTYINQMIDDYRVTKNRNLFLLCLQNIAKATGGVGELAKKTGKTRQAIYHALSSKGNPRLDTFLDIITALGFKFTLTKV